MMYYFLILIYSILLFFTSTLCQQRVAPGVPPQRYEQTQQYHQPPAQQFQQPPQQQYNAPPPPQQYQQQQHQQQPVHNHQGHPQQVLNAANIQQEKEHLGEHLDLPNLDTSKMTEQELQFHYFKMHDADNNNKLDGCELIKSLIHWHEQGHKDPNNPSQAKDKLFKDEELTNLIDPIMNMDDSNNDGYIDYPEFIRAQQKAANQAKP